MRRPIIDIIFEAELIDEVLELESISEEDYIVESDIEIVNHTANNPYLGPYVITPS